MHGPYSAKIVQSGKVVAEFGETDVSEGEKIADRFYQGAGTGTLEGFTRAATFAAALVLDPGEDADVEIHGRVGTENSSRPCQASAFDGDHRYCSRCDGTGRETARPVHARTVSVRRDDRGRLVTSLGVRFGERVFVGV